MKQNYTKNKGQVFTPNYIVNIILDECHYNSVSILEKHIIDNSCGDGALLKVIVSRYIDMALSQSLTKSQIKHHLETYIHGIEIDTIAYKRCLSNLDKISVKYGIFGVKWDLYNSNALTFTKFNKQMDFVVGNPPYIRVHNMSNSYNEVKSFKFCNGGMTDIYLAFFEIGFNMLNANGQLCYITPNSWINSVAGVNLRDYIQTHKNLVTLIDFGHFQVFDNVTTYSMIAHFKKNLGKTSFLYKIYDNKTKTTTVKEELKLSESFIDNKFFFCSKEELKLLKEIKSYNDVKYVTVKNGFATLNDKVFIGKEIPDTIITIDILKASNSKWYKCLFPYDKQGNPLSEEEIFNNKTLKKYFNENKERLLKGKEEKENWYLFGRTQGLLDVYRDKMAINVLLRNINDIKCSFVKEGCGVYSGLYITKECDIEFEEVEKILKSEEFVSYVKSHKKYKSGGYYTFNSKEVEKFLNYKLSQKFSKKIVV